MAHTRGIRADGVGARHMDDGELLDKEGKPINPIAHQSGETWTGVPGQVLPDADAVARFYAGSTLDAPGPVLSDQSMPIVEAKPVKYRCDATTILRDMDGWMAFRLMDLALGGLSVTLDEEAYRRLAADLKINFRQVS